MEARENLKKLQEEQEELAKSKHELRGEVADFEVSEEYADYIELVEKNDEVTIAIKYAKEHAIFKQMDSMKELINKHYDKVVEAAKELYKQINKEIEEVEKKIEIDKKFVEKTESEIKVKQEELKQLKETDAYKNGDEETVLKAEELEAQIDAKLALKDKISSRLNAFEKQLVDIKKQKEELVEEFGELDELNENEKKTTDEPEKDDDNADKNEKKTKTGKGTPSKGGASYVPTGVVEEEKKESEDKTEQDPEEKLKADFKELYSKAKRGALTDKDFDKLAEIMKNPENYDKLNITTGIIFNKAKVIFKAMAKKSGIEKVSVKDMSKKIYSKLKKAKAVVEQDRESLDEEGQIKWDNAEKHVKQYESIEVAMKAYEDVLEERNSKKWWYVQVEEIPEALPEGVDSKKDGKDRLDLSGDVYAPDEVDPSVLDERDDHSKPAKDAKEIE